jgi:hypothetical protein
VCFQRKPSLGRYNGSRACWQRAYRAARVAAKDGGNPKPAHSGIQWKAELIVAYERDDAVDPLACPVANRLEAQRLIDQILLGKR